MNLAYEYGADRIWIVNVGDLKPMEFPTEFFLHLAWNPKAWPEERLAEYIREWAEREFGPKFAPRIAALMAAYGKYAGRRKPELIDPTTFSLIDYQEADRVAAEWDALTAEAEGISTQLPANARDAFFQLILFPIKASAQVTELYSAAAKNRLYAAQGRASANDWAAKTRELFKADADLSAQYNHDMAGGKWDHMMDQTHIGYTTWQEPRQNNMPAVKEIQLPAAPGMKVAIEGSASAWPGATGDAALPRFDVFSQPRHYIDVFNAGQGSLDFAAKASAPWIMLSESHGAVAKDQRLWVSVDWTKAPKGAGGGSVSLSGPNGATVDVQVLALNPQTEMTRKSLQGFVESNGYVSIEASHYTN